MAWWHSGVGACLAWACFGCASDPTSTPTSALTPDATAVRAQVFTACTEFAARLCAGVSDCCQRGYGAYDAEGCRQTMQDQVCRPGADAVAAGFADYDEYAVEPCLAAHADANAICIPNWQETIALRKSLWSTCKVLRGKTEPGKGCTTDVTCAEPDGEKTVACIAGACRVLEVIPLGEPCPFQSGAVSTCDAGAYCTTTQDVPGVCSEPIATGFACSGVLGDPSCGFGNYCDSETHTCQKTTNLGGPSCKQGLECVSFECDRTTRICAPAPAIVSPDLCLGPVF